MTTPQTMTSSGNLPKEGPGPAKYTVEQTRVRCETLKDFFDENRDLIKENALLN